MQDYLWYASYGSNLKEKRFHCYIEGGRPHGARRIYLGCVDKSLPLDNKPIKIDYPLYFAKKASIWNNGGVGFIGNRKDVKVPTFGRMYLITRSQFIDVIRQENSDAAQIDVDFDMAIKKGGLVIRDNAWYGKLLYLGKDSDAPIFTFTHQKTIPTKVRPDENYLKTLIQGLQESHSLGDQEIVDYLIEKEGVKGNYSRDGIKQLIQH
ncbi:hypothetical protein QWY93_07095 [Echinicola jeungdonensis]|uniref:Histone deacetylase n=1 Tax=Echinicola jeungdonensis TaxID=709343 RepID=A0ABV5J8Y6_9BACT|nr:hypothetical protein [Echinicola jeungdonensis]MDN3669089.1 hypothetical protein [Echinicola jeungdonensis]